MSLGINLRVTGHSNQAAKFAKDHLLREIVNNKLFWSKYDSDVLRAIREGYISTHYAMWREQEKWPKTATGLPSTAGTTASVAFIFRKKIYIGHVGDSGIVLGYQEDGEKCWKAKPLTQDHKPECNVEKARIINAGGKVVTKSGVPRVVWNRPRIGHKGPVRRSTPFDEIPFLAVARSLGDLWIFGTDGLWNVVTPDQAVDMARDAEIVNERLMFMGGNSSEWTNPSKFLVEKALERWSVRRMRADNTSVITVFLDQPGQPKKSVTGNNNGIIDRWSNTTRYELKYEMENEYNPEHVIYNRYNEMDSNDVLSSCHTENQQDYYYDQYGASSSTSIMDREHILSSSGHEINGNEL
ncbi:protein phosphatase 1D [Condylostylus longicornis]|uniref:protein phosphatase 1D n=1 Tax=Condylostylus longicornis TaxID=2530218 RepID=UPI00244D9DBB|nr:protein phosphatase 1D [Condylostylus longicornis]